MKILTAKEALSILSSGGHIMYFNKNEKDAKWKLFLTSSKTMWGIFAGNNYKFTEQSEPWAESFKRMRSTIPSAEIESPSYDTLVKVCRLAFNAGMRESDKSKTL